MLVDCPRSRSDMDMASATYGPSLLPVQPCSAGIHSGPVLLADDQSRVAASIHTASQPWTQLRIATDQAIRDVWRSNEAAPGGLPVHWPSLHCCCHCGLHLSSRAQRLAEGPGEGYSQPVRHGVCCSRSRGSVGAGLPPSKQECRACLWTATRCPSCTVSASLMTAALASSVWSCSLSTGQSPSRLGAPVRWPLSRSLRCGV